MREYNKKGAKRPITRRKADIICAADIIPKGYHPLTKRISLKKPGLSGLFLICNTAAGTVYALLSFLQSTCGLPPSPLQGDESAGH